MVTREYAAEWWSLCEEDPGPSSGETSQGMETGAEVQAEGSEFAGGTGEGSSGTELGTGKCGAHRRISGYDRSNIGTEHSQASVWKSYV